MDDSQFDGLARTVGLARRTTLKGLLGISLGLGLGHGAQDDGEAKKHRKKRKGKGKGNTNTPPPACQPVCANRTCGDDGCGGSCGSCQAGFTCTASGSGRSCQQDGCQPQCNGKSCGDNGCGGSCGTCPSGQTCSNGSCVCVRNCNGKTCGSDGCGGSCGTCGSGQTCNNGSCVCVPNCAGKTCGNNGCGGSCGSCSGGQTCNNGACGCATPCGNTCCGPGQICVGNECWADSEELAFLTLINQYRVQNGRSQLSLNTKLGKAAELHSQDQAAGNFSSHAGSNGSTFEQRITAQGYTYSWAGENIFWSIPDGSANAAFTWWKGSPDHNANMLSTNFTEIGIGRSHRTANDRWFWTTDFGRPA